jgi:ABC-type siderophore export system fused ATPase/permease subunit
MSRTVKPHSEKLDDVVIETSKGQEYTVGEIKHSNRIQKSATPKQDLSWYVKWTASIFILASMSIRGVEGLQQYDLMLSLVGVACWMWVGFLWKDRALILLNGVGIILFLNTLIRDYLAV